MKNNSFTINYPSIFCGTEKSHISFLSGKPDLVSVFNPGQNPENKRRFFVTDATVASLDCMKDFISKFEIALKECNESEYWLELLYETNSISENEFNKMQSACIELRRMLVSTVTTIKSKQ